MAFTGGDWAGDYLAAGVTGITMDANNLGSTDLDLRLLFQTGQGGVVSPPIPLAAGSGWTQLTFPVDAGLLTSVFQLRLYHSAPNGTQPVDIAAQLGIDNVTAVPEPEAWLMLLAGIGTLVAGSRRRRQVAG